MLYSVYTNLEQERAKARAYHEHAEMRARSIQRPALDFSACNAMTESLHCRNVRAQDPASRAAHRLTRSLRFSLSYQRVDFRMSLTRTMLT
jgi:hypothetical protein